jgi:hypothetical protein
MIRRALFCSIVLQIAGVSAFLSVGQLAPSGWLKAATILAFIAGMILVIYKSFPEHRIKRSLLYSLPAAACFVVVYQVVGFTFAPGIVKDIAPFSAQHLAISGIVFLAMLAFHNACCICSAKKPTGDRSAA